MKKIPEKCLLTPEGGQNIIETELATLWKEDGVVYSRSKHKKRTLKHLQEYFENLKELGGGEKIYLIGDVNEMQNYSEEEKAFLNKQMHEQCAGLALLSCKPMGKMMATVTILRKKPDYPVKMFETLEEARKWITEIRTKEQHR